MPTDEPTERRGVEPVEVVDLAEHAQALAKARAAGTAPPAGRLLGLPELPNADVWVDTAGAAAVTGIAPKTITGWLSRGGPKALPFPAARRFLYRTYWPLSELEDWTEAYRAEQQSGA
ncbi:hypothetical protein ABT299_44975 [Spirillospora sp. NPDC000708]